MIGCIDKDADTSIDCDALEDMFTRVLTPQGIADDETEILIGKLPANLPIDFPMVSDSQIVGSIVIYSQYGDATEIILNVPGNPDDIISFYRNHLMENGWIEDDFSGEFSSPLSYGHAQFCSENGAGMSLQITAYKAENIDYTDLRLNLHTGMGSFPCSPSDFHSEESILPLLREPEGSVSFGSSTGSGGDSHYAELNLKTKLSLQELEIHYKEQLLNTSWKLERQDVSDIVIWDIFTVFGEDGDEWTAIMIVHDVVGDLKRIKIQMDSKSGYLANPL